MAQDVATALGCEVGAIVKSLLFKIEDDFTLSLVVGDKKCSLNKLKKIKNIKNVLIASPEEIKTQTGYVIGGVSPVGHLNRIKIFIEKSLKRFNNILKQQVIRTVFLKLILLILKK